MIACHWLPGAEPTVTRCEGLPVVKRQALRFHDLRHTAASLMVGGGVPIFDVAKILGHSTVGVTMRYAHFAPEAGRIRDGPTTTWTPSQCLDCAREFANLSSSIPQCKPENDRREKAFDGRTPGWFRQPDCGAASRRSYPKNANCGPVRRISAFARRA